MRVLIVDDNEIELGILENLLQGHGYEVMCAANGAEALEVLRRTGCRLVVSDWMMPRMNGIDLCRAVRTEFDAYVYFILLTGRESLRERLEGMAAGADDFLVKPYQQEEL